MKCNVKTGNENTIISMSWMLGAKYQSAPCRDGTCAISSTKICAPISRLLKQSRDGAAPTPNDFY